MDFLYCLVCLREILLHKKIKTWKKSRVVTASVLKFRVVSRPPCPRLAARLDARVCKCSMDSYPESRPNPTRVCSATSNEADTRATRQRLRRPATHTETTEPTSILLRSTWQHDRGLHIHTQHLQNRAGATIVRD